MTVKNAVAGACQIYEQKTGIRLRRSAWVYLFVNPSIRAATLVRLAASPSRSQVLWRNMLLTLHGCDVAPGANICGSLMLPHPLGIVIGEGVTLGSGVTLYQNVTLGTDGTGRYPTVGENATIYTGAVIVGDVQIEASKSVRALSRMYPGALD